MEYFNLQIKRSEYDLNTYKQADGMQRRTSYPDEAMVGYRSPSVLNCVGVGEKIFMTSHLRCTFSNVI